MRPDAMRVVSLLPSATEIVCALGARAQLVGVSHECDHPPGVEQLPNLTRPRRALPSGSAAIDRTVREILAQALGVYEIDVDLLRSLRADVVVTQDLCDVCAVSMDDVRSALAELAGSDVSVVSLRPTRLAEVWEDVRRVGRVLDLAGAAERVAGELGDRCERLAERCAGLGPPPSVLTIEWLDPVMVGGLWMPELVSLAGGVPLVTVPGQHAPTLSRAELERLDPDVVLVKPCGFDLERSARELHVLRANLPWSRSMGSRWKAVEQGRVFLADGSAFFNRPGPRLVESLEILAACMHPGAFPELRGSPSVRRVTAELALEPL